MNEIHSIMTVVLSSPEAIALSIVATACLISFAVGTIGDTLIKLH